MNINKHNYPIWFVYYWDALLSTEQKSELMQWLENNPEKSNEFHAFEKLKIQPETLRFERKAALKVNTTELGCVEDDNLDAELIGLSEGDLSSQHANQLMRFIEMHPVVKAEYALYRHTFLKADRHIVYEDKAELKHTAVFSPYHWKAAAAAAVLLAFIYFYYPKLNKEKTLSENAKGNPPALRDVHRVSRDKDYGKPQLSAKRTSNGLTQPSAIKNRLYEHGVEKLPAAFLAICQIPYREVKEIKPTESKLPLPVACLPRQDLAEEQKPVNAVCLPEQKEEDFLSTLQVLSHFFNRSLHNLTEVVHHEEAKLTAGANGSIRKISAHLGRHISIDTQFDKEGRLEAFAFDAGKFGVEKNINHNK